MIAAIMQPYFFPYIGYFQLMRAVDVFVVFDDVQYMKGGWINRNRILAHDVPSWFTLPVKRDALSLPINEREYVREPWVRRLEQQLQASYAKAPGYRDQEPWLRELLEHGDTNVARYNTHVLLEIARELGIDCDILVSSQMEKSADLKGQARVIDLCYRVGATTYVNAIGGIELYDAEAFDVAGIELQFLRSEPDQYEQFGAAHVPLLSIIDVLMFNPTKRMQSMLSNFSLVAQAAMLKP